MGTGDVGDEGGGEKRRWHESQRYLSEGGERLAGPKPGAFSVGVERFLGSSESAGRIFGCRGRCTAASKRRWPPVGMTKIGIKEAAKAAF
jgi:hypothetical protein